VSAAAVPASDAERFLTFEVAATIYALPIAEVHEVVEVRRICCVPTIPRSNVGVMNWHGDALPVVAAKLLLEPGDPEDAELAEEEIDAEAMPERVEGEFGADAVMTSSDGGGHVLIVSSNDDEPARLALPVDRVLGLVDGPRRRRGGGGLIVERRPVDGRVVNVLDPRRLVVRAIEVIGRHVA
jgi:chemotaxis signal transduction protein